MTYPRLLDACPVLRDMIVTGKTLTAQGQAVPFHSGIRIDYAEALYRQVVARRPSVVVEIGMAHGVSSLAILTALAANGSGHLISIDPYQQSHWGSCGRTAIERAGYREQHEMITEPDWVALPDLWRKGMRVDFGYIDGSHAFDYALLDTFYLDKLLPPGGVLAFNDCGLPAIEKVILYLQSHRHYTELDVGLRFVRGHPFGLGNALRNPLLLPRLLTRLTPANFATWRRPHQDRYFEKQDDWQPLTDIPLPF